MTQISASRLTALIRPCQAGCLELLDYFIARVERLDRLLNAVVVHDFDRARARRPEYWITQQRRVHDRMTIAVAE
jgi:hypothetical protein